MFATLLFSTFVSPRNVHLIRDFPVPRKLWYAASCAGVGESGHGAVVLYESLK